MKSQLFSPIQGSQIFLGIFEELKLRGDVVSPRGQKVIEIENFAYELPPYTRFSSFKARKFNVQYVKDEFAWYLKGDKFDSSIAEKASLWKRYVKPDGSINSNYGQYVFGKLNQFDDAKKELETDKDTRRAAISILSAEHVLSEDADLPCTYAINFRIRENRLNMTVHMRSQDAIFGLGNDAPAFSFIHEMMFNALKEKYPDLEHGWYTHFADSFHVYERHFEMLDKIIEEGEESYEKIECPRISGPDEVRALRNSHVTREVTDPSHEFVKWLLNA